jgi:hypothetical protein
VHQAAAGDQAVEREVLRLLHLDAGAEEWLDGLRPPTEVVQSAADLHAFFPGQVLAARYEIQQFLAVGGMGEVYSAHDLQLDQRIAIKVIAGELATADQLSLLKREVQAARRIQHANVCRVFDLVQTEVARGRSAVFLTMELLEGETLSQKLHREGALTERQAMPLIRQMVAALSAAHQAGVIHGDFKSSNVMIVPREGGSARAVVTDFGLARRLAPGRGQTLLSSSHEQPGRLRHSRLHVAGADPGRQGQPGGRYLRAGRGALRDADRRVALRRRFAAGHGGEEIARTTGGAGIAVAGAAAHLVRRDPQVHGGRTGRRFADVREVLTHLETRTRRGLWWKLIRRRHRRLLRIAAVTAWVVAALFLARWLWPAEPGAQAVADWQQGVYDLQAGEPVAAARRLERAIAQHRLPPVAHAYLAWAWHELGFTAKAEAELANSRRKPLQPETDRLFEQAAAAELRGQPSRRARSWRGGVCWPIWRSSTINWAVPRRRTNGSRSRRSFRIIRPRICGWPKRRRSRANGSRPSGNSFWRRPTSALGRRRYGARGVGEPRLRAGGKRRSRASPQRPALALQPATAAAEYRLWALRADRHADVGPGRQFRAARRSDPLRESGLRRLRTG